MAMKWMRRKKNAYLPVSGYLRDVEMSAFCTDGTSRQANCETSAYLHY